MKSKKNIILKLSLSMTSLFLTSCFSHIERYYPETIVDNSTDNKNASLNNIYDTTTVKFGQIIYHQVDFISLGYDGKTDYLVSSVKVVEGEKVEEIKDLKRAGYRFDGWFFEKDFKNLFSFDDPVYDDYTLYAKWTGTTTYSLKNNEYYVEKISNEQKGSTLIIPSSHLTKPVVGISDNAFMNNTSIEIVNIPKTVKYIGANAFKSCSNLKIIYLPSNLETIGADAFYGCTSLETVYYANTVYNWASNVHTADPKIEPYQTLTSLATNFYCLNKEPLIEEEEEEEEEKGEEKEEIPEEDKPYFVKPDGLVLTFENYPNIRINSFAFYGCKQISSLNISSRSVRYIEKFAFANCTNLEFLSLSNASTLTTINESAFENCIKMRSNDLGHLFLPNILYDIGEKAFSNCKSIKAVNFNSASNINLKIIPPYCFYNCNLESFICPKNIVIIKPFAFAENRNMKSFTGPDALKYICQNAFYNCTSLTTALMPSNYTLRETGNTSLKNITS